MSPLLLWDRLLGRGNIHEENLKKLPHLVTRHYFAQRSCCFCCFHFQKTTVKNADAPRHSELTKLHLIGFDKNDIIQL